ncbi:hypothetical protein SteCoe_23208 [Stentor coeruleus]|uniref:Uncharacterized protein n=1 Tax=Stentor coeruleus TaxID=5963 RepID=A0A1R2BKG7_9CILI|nr:hypothetical protein SteCoe_23208 [Stentor coeruleus]
MIGKFKAESLPGVNLSTLAMQENRRATNNWRFKYDNSLEKSLQGIKETNLRVKLDSKEIDRMMIQLERISKNTAYGISSIELYDQSTLEVCLLANEFQHIIVKTLEMSTPLNILLEDLNGKVEIYASKKIKNPSKSINDFLVTTNYLKISDASYRFSTECAYMNFYAVTNSHFIIRVWFGHSWPKTKVIKHSRDFSKSEISVDKTDLLPLEPLNISKSTKNFVKLNKLDASKKLCYPIKFNHEDKVTQVKNKREAIFNKTISEKFYKANKKEIEHYAKKTFSQITETIHRKTYFEKQWISMLYVAIFSTQLKTKFVERKKKSENFVIFTSSVYFLQRSLIYFFYRNTNIRISIRRAKNHLKLYHHFFHKLTISSLHKPIISLIKIKAHQISMVSKFDIFTKKIKKIQKIWLNYRLNEDFKLQELLNIFEAAIQKKIRYYGRLKKKKNEKISNALKEFPQELLKDIAKNHLFKCKVLFINNLQKYAKKIIPKISMKERIELIRHKKFILVSPPPEYIYMLTITEAVKILEPYIHASG